MKKTSFLLLIAMLMGSAAPAAENPASFKVNEDSLRVRVLESNLSLEAEQNYVQDAKDKVSLARANLLPSLNLGALLSISSGPKFILSAVQFLLPFLFPSNWFNLYEEKNLYQAERISYDILELNTYGSVLSLYYTILSDQKVRDVYTQQAKDLRQIADILQQTSDDFGTVSVEDLQHALAQAEMSEVQASHLAELSKQEIAALRNALSLPLETDIALDTSSGMPTSSYESRPIAEAVTVAQNAAPELQQIQYLVQAARNDKWSKAFGFLGGASIGAQGYNGGAASFSTLRVSGNVSIGMAIFPTIRLSNRNIEEVQLQDTVMRQEMVQVLESTLKSLGEAKTQFNLASSAEKRMMDVYLAKQEQYDLGLCSFMTVLLARTQMTAASVARIQAETDLNLLRTTLHRSLISDVFAKVKPCNPQETGRRRATLDEVCSQSQNVSTANEF